MGRSRSSEAAHWPSRRPPRPVQVRQPNGAAGRGHAGPPPAGSPATVVRPSPPPAAGCARAPRSAPAIPQGGGWAKKTPRPHPGRGALAVPPSSPPPHRTVQGTASARGLSAPGFAGNGGDRPCLRRGRSRGAGTATPAPTLTLGSLRGVLPACERRPPTCRRLASRPHLRARPRHREGFSVRSRLHAGQGPRGPVQEDPAKWEAGGARALWRKQGTASGGAGRRNASRICPRSAARLWRALCLCARPGSCGDRGHRHGAQALGAFSARLCLTPAPAPRGRH